MLVVRSRQDAAWEVLMMLRPGGAEFAPNAFVYPGGSVHAEDRVYPDLHRAAAIRELFEEVGLLLARRGDRRFARDADCGLVRERLAAGEPFPAALAGAGLIPAFDRLAMLTRWITPEALKRRFDTHFYMAKLPPGQTVHPQEGEVVAWRWVVPAEAVADREFEMVPATRQILASVASEPDPFRLIGRLRRRLPPEPVRPVLVFEGDRVRVEVPPQRRARRGPTDLPS